MKKKKSIARRVIKKPAAKKKNWSAGLIENVWPQERDFFERPDRYRYVRKLLPDTSACVFCGAAAAGVGFESLVLAEDDHAMVLMNKFPYNTGHLLVLPKAHQSVIWEMDDQLTASISGWTKTSIKILKDEMKCQGFNVGLNLGAVAGAGIPDHLHWHIVPRWSGDTNFFPLIAETKVLPETLLQTYERLRPHFDRVRVK